jgi:hypothetical protein
LPWQSPYSDENVQKTKPSQENKRVEEHDGKVPSTTSDVGDIALAVHSAVQDVVPVVFLPKQHRNSRREQECVQSREIVPLPLGTW